MNSKEKKAFPFPKKMLLMSDVISFIHVVYHVLYEERIHIYIFNAVRCVSGGIIQKRYIDSRAFAEQGYIMLVHAVGGKLVGMCVCVCVDERALRWNR